MHERREQSENRGTAANSPAYAQPIRMRTVRATSTFAKRAITSTDMKTTELTYQVEPNTRAIVVTFFVSSSKTV
jgi:hypothetical protein